MKKLLLFAVLPFAALAGWEAGTWDYYDGTSKLTESETLEECKAIAEADTEAEHLQACRNIVRFYPEEPTDPTEPTEPPPEPTDPPPNGAIFSADFSTYPDQQITEDCRFRGDAGCGAVPEGFDFTYVRDSIGTLPACEIKDGVLKVYDEGYGDSNSWGHDCQLAKFFDQQYQPLRVRMEIRFEPGFNGNLCKIFRMGMYNPDVANGVTGTSFFNTNRVTESGQTIGALNFVDAGYDKLKVLHRGDEWYKLGTRREQKWDPAVSIDVWDGQWRVIEFTMAVNSAPGEYDGVFEITIDGQTHVKDYINYLNGTPSQSVTGVNAFTLGGNCDWTGYSGERLLYEIRRIDVF